jgi:hypothetical protein
MRTILYRPIIATTWLLSMLLILPTYAQVPPDCEISDDVLQGIRQMLTAEDNGLFFEIWSNEDIACACIELYYNDPPDAFLHDRVITGAVVLLGMTGDPRAVPVLIDAIDTHPPQALYNLGNFPTVNALNALTAHVRDENPEARENAAEGLRMMGAPPEGEMEDGWLDALISARDEVGDWMLIEPEADFRDYFIDAYTNLEHLIASGERVTARE